MRGGRQRNRRGSKAERNRGREEKKRQLRGVNNITDEMEKMNVG